MKTNTIVLTLLAALALLATCASPSGGGGGGGSGGGGGGGGGGGDHSYSFHVDYGYVTHLYSGEDLDPAVAYGSVVASQDGDLTTGSVSLPDGTAGMFANNNLAQVDEGDSVDMTVTIDGHDFTGSATVPVPLSGVTFDTATRVVTWSTTPIDHGTFVTVRAGPTNASTLPKADFSAGQLTLPDDFAPTGVGNKITVFATNVATDLAPGDDFDDSYFRVSRADGALNVDTFDVDLP